MNEPGKFKKSWYDEVGRRRCCGFFPSNCGFQNTKTAGSIVVTAILEKFRNDVKCQDFNVGLSVAIDKLSAGQDICLRLQMKLRI